MDKQKDGAASEGTAQRLVVLLERWESAYSGYAINNVPMRERLKFTTHHSTENVGALVNETRDAIKQHNESEVSREAKESDNG